MYDVGIYKSTWNQHLFQKRPISEILSFLTILLSYYIKEDSYRDWYKYYDAI